MDIHSFTIYEEYFGLISTLKPKKAEHLLYAIVEYMFHSIEPTLDKEEKAYFESLRRALDKQKSNSKRSKGHGAPIGNQNALKNSNQKQTENKPNSNQKQTHLDVNVDVNNIINFIENNFNKTISSYEYEQIELLVNKYSNEIVLYAFKKTLEAGKKSLNYTKAILKHWEEDNLKTLEEIEKQDRKKGKIIPGWFNKPIENGNISSEEEKGEFKNFIEEFRKEEKQNDKNI